MNVTTCLAFCILILPFLRCAGSTKRTHRLRTFWAFIVLVPNIPTSLLSYSGSFQILFSPSKRFIILIDEYFFDLK